MSSLPLIIQHVVATHARLRMVCEAMGIDPQCVRLEDVDQHARLRLMDLGECDWIQWLNGETPDATE